MDWGLFECYRYTEECVCLPEAHMEAFMVTLYLMEAIGPPQLLMHLWVRNLAQIWRWPERDFPFNIACHFIPEYSWSLLFILSISPYPPDISSSHPLRVYFVSLSLSLSLFLSLLSSPRCLPFPHAWFSLPVALQRKFNIGLFGVSKDSIRRSSGHYTKTNISCCGQEQQNIASLSHHAHFCSTGLVSCSLLSDSFSLLNLLFRTSLLLSKSESVERVV